MGDHRDLQVEDVSEERTEPFSQSEIDARIKSWRANEPTEEELDDVVPLNLLKVEDHHHRQGIRLLVRPLTRGRPLNPDPGSYQWLALKAEVASEDNVQHKVLAVAQTSRDIKFSLRMRPGTISEELPHLSLWCELYYDPASDNQIFVNRLELPITVMRVSEDASDAMPLTYEINPDHTKALSPGTWRIIMESVSVLDFRVLEKMPVTLLHRPSSAVEYSSDSSSGFELTNSSGKRTLSIEASDRPCGKRTKTSDGSVSDNEGVIMFLKPRAQPLVFAPPSEASTTDETSRQLVRTNGHALLDVQEEETIEVQGEGEFDTYALTKQGQIASNAISSVFTAEHSEVPGGVVAVKVLKTTRPHGNKPNGPAPRPQEAELHVINQANMWFREYHAHQRLHHDSIVRLWGGDARFLSLYMEHVDARDLASRPQWRRPQDDLFAGTRYDAGRILRDVASALHYLHANPHQRLAHNDIKPANILYSPERGAVLCDFGLSTPADGPSRSPGGTPYYVPPEFLGARQRGLPSDVWALGVTMLYVLRKIPLPEARMRQPPPEQRGGRPPLYWMIRDLHRPAGMVPARSGPGARNMSPVEQMRMWLGEVREASGRLDRGVVMERLVRDMLIPNPNQRITTARIVKEMREVLSPGDDDFATTR